MGNLGHKTLSYCHIKFSSGVATVGFWYLHIQLSIFVFGFDFGERQLVDGPLCATALEPLIVLAASPGLGAETMPFDVEPRRAADEVVVVVHAVTTPAAVHGRAEIRLLGQSK